MYQPAREIIASPAIAPTTIPTIDPPPSVGGLGYDAVVGNAGEFVGGALVAVLFVELELLVLMVPVDVKVVEPVPSVMLK